MSYSLGTEYGSIEHRVDEEACGLPARTDKRRRTEQYWLSCDIDVCLH